MSETTASPVFEYPCACEGENGSPCADCERVVRFDHPIEPGSVPFCNRCY